jgi:hypothetical protein
VFTDDAGNVIETLCRHGMTLAFRQRGVRVQMKSSARFLNLKGSRAMTHWWSWKAFEAPGVELVFQRKIRQSIMRSNEHASAPARLGFLLQPAMSSAPFRSTTRSESCESRYDASDDERFSPAVASDPRINRARGITSA